MTRIETRRKRERFMECIPSFLNNDFFNRDTCFLDIASKKMVTNFDVFSPLFSATLTASSLSNSSSTMGDVLDDGGVSSNIILSDSSIFMVLLLEPMTETDIMSPTPATLVIYCLRALNLRFIAIKYLLWEKEKKTYLLAVGYFRSEDYLHSATLVDTCLESQVMATEEAKDLATLPLDKLVENLKIYEMILENDGVVSKTTTKENVKSLALKAKVTREQTSDDSDSQGESDEEEAEAFNFSARNFRKFFRKGHFASECRKPKENKAFVRGVWSDSEDLDEQLNDSTCLMEIDSHEIVDSGCTKHMTGNRRLFTSYKAYDGGHVAFGRNLKGKVVGRGVFLGYSQTSKAYIVLNKETMRIEESLNVTFDESLPKPKPSPSIADDRINEPIVQDLNGSQSLQVNVSDEGYHKSLKEARGHTIEQVIAELNERTLRVEKRRKELYENMQTTHIVKENSLKLNSEIKCNHLHHHYNCHYLIMVLPDNQVNSAKTILDDKALEESSSCSDFYADLHLNDEEDNGNEVVIFQTLREEVRTRIPSSLIRGIGEFRI
nr:hypothetical protein [Tanacetum cinerariifolium]